MFAGKTLFNIGGYLQVFTRGHTTAAYLSTLENDVSLSVVYSRQAVPSLLNVVDYSRRHLHDHRFVLRVCGLRIQVVSLLLQVSATSRSTTSASTLSLCSPYPPSVPERGLFSRLLQCVQYLWIPQVIVNVVLAALAGGPYRTGTALDPLNKGNGAFCFPFPKHPTLLAFRGESPFSLGPTAVGSLIAKLLEIRKLIPNAVRNNANASGSRKSALDLLIPLPC
ncbi:hypothetical protein BV22DRAFT_1200379 [Leucogyrophana mollusca]|uniref:Uncharacterized protein n=1 Tax=Leucogyrophana mollusca TaxID=85980 RepID=A0ACB8AWS7_9AGAM|nr:hypothetical protein BV22DRAFT_1200379 [Leucogyrophana mollusca]